MKPNINKRLISIGLTGTLLFAGAVPATATNPSFETQNTTKQMSLATSNSLYPFEYEIINDSDCVEITNLSSDYSGALTIPSTIDGLPVTSIGYFAFSRCDSLTSITLPNSLTTIDNSAFYGCSALSSITIPNSVTNLDDYAFKNCQSLKSITIPNSVSNLGAHLFEDCTGLTSVVIGNSVSIIDSYTFFNCKNLTSVQIPDSVTNINNYAFSGCDNLTIQCSEGSFAHTFAQAKNIPFQIVSSVESKEYAMKLESTKAYNNGVLEDTNESNINNVIYKAKL